MLFLLQTTALESSEPVFIVVLKRIESFSRKLTNIRTKATIQGTHLSKIAFSAQGNLDCLPKAQ